MFSDLSGYTALNESFDPEEVEALMARVKADASAVIERHGGTVNQFVGDEIMALFGIPVARRDDARRAVAAALELHAVVDAYLATLEPAFARSLAMHTGIATGLVVARRSDARAGDFALTGDAVNTAARLRSAAASREVVVSATTWQQVSDAFDAESTAPLALKGKDQPLVAYRILGARKAPAGDATALVGRDEELRDFRALAEACAQRRRSRVVIVRGDPGVGKSRLVAEFVAIGARRSASRATARRCSTSAPRPGATRCAASRAACSASTARADEATRRTAIERASAARPMAAGAAPLPARPARRRAAGRAARARRGDEHDGARAGLAARARATSSPRSARRCRCSSSSRTSTGPTPGRSSASPRSPCWPRGSRCCW